MTTLNDLIWFTFCSQSQFECLVLNWLRLAYILDSFEIYENMLHWWNWTFRSRKVYDFFKKIVIKKRKSYTCQQTPGCLRSNINLVKGEGSSSYLSNGKSWQTRGSQDSQRNEITGWAFRGGKLILQPNTLPKKVFLKK